MASYEGGRFPLPSRYGQLHEDDRIDEEEEQPPISDQERRENVQSLIKRFISFNLRELLQASELGMH